MAEKNDTIYSNLFSSIISEIKSYSGKDPLLPWLRGIKKIKESLPPQILTEKLPRFLQKCTQTFESDRRYHNDLRYLRVWLQLMDFMDDPKVLLRRMEMNHIGTKRSLYYQAYALYCEKIKNFDEAEKMYHLGVQNLAEPVDELQKSYEQFLNRMERHKKKKIQRQEGKTDRRPFQCSELKENSEACIVENRNKMSSALHNGQKVESKEEILGSKNMSKKRALMERQLDDRKVGNDDTVVVKFVDTAIVGKSEAEDACHHGLVDPTINLKEAMNAINSMFREPIETAPIGRRSHRRQQKEDKSLNFGFKVFDENLDGGINASIQLEDKGQQGKARSCKPEKESFEIYIDDEGNSEAGEGNDEKDNLEQIEVQNSKGGSISSASHLNLFVFPSPNDLSPESSDDIDARSSRRRKLREDTVVHRFVGSAISDEPVVENVCHHGLVDPTINLKEAMQDINNMFGKPIDFVRAKRKNQDNAPAKKHDLGGFSILPDDELEHQERQPSSKSSGKLSDSDLFEPTVFTKEAVDDINKMFGMPLDF
ncbi:hypothetical protein REPUB_Repub03eG0233200 [Reevesia pubescens]